MNHHLQSVDNYPILGVLLSDQWEDVFLLDPQRLMNLMAQVVAITPEVIADRAIKVKESYETQQAYTVDSNGIALVELKGPISKSGSSLSPAGSSTAAKQAIRRAVREEKVKGILLNIESPGGAWAGTSELNAEVAKAAASKPLYVAGEEIVASGGYLAATSATRIFLNDPGVVGSIGVYTTIADRSAAYEKAGIEIKLVKFGRDKGIGADGIKITESQLKVLQQRVDEIGGMFIEQVSAGRRVNVETVSEWATGRTYSARDGLKMGLIDQIGTPEEAMAALVDRVNGKVSRQVQGVKAMNYSEIVAACRGINPAVAEDAVFLAKLQQQGNLTTESVKDAWIDEKDRRADAKLKEADAKVKASQDEADAKIKAAEAKASDAQLADELAPGGKPAPKGETGGQASKVSGGAHPFKVAVRDLMSSLKVSESEATIMTIRDNPDLHRQFVLDANPKTAKQWDYRSDDNDA